MYSSILFLIFLSICFYGQCDSFYGYHERVGIPKAKYLLRTEGFAAAIRIVGGSQVPISSFIPHQAGLIVTLTSGGTSICGGTLISATRVVTAAHCWADGTSQARQFTVVLGSPTIFTGGTRLDTSNVVMHASWNPNAITNDIAMVKFPSITFNNNIQALGVPAAAEAGADFTGMAAIASGYGKTTDAQTSFPPTTTLYQVSLTIISNTECQKQLDVAIHGSHLCTSGAGGVGTCDGDSGGPLTVMWNNRRILVGVTSFGLGDGCQLGYPSVFTRVTTFIGWIQANL